MWGDLCSLIKSRKRDPQVMMLKIGEYDHPDGDPDDPFQWESHLSLSYVTK